MKIYRIISAFLTLAVTASFSGCLPKNKIENNIVEENDGSSSIESSLKKENEKEKQEDKFLEDLHEVTLDDIREHAEKLLEDAKVSNNEKSVKEDIDTLIHDINCVSEYLSYVNIEYYCDWLNDDLQTKYNDYFETYYVGSELALYAFSNAYCQEEYSDILKDYIFEDSLDYYIDRGMSMKRVEGYSKVDCNLTNELIDEYYDVINSDESDEEKNLKAAEIYIEILKNYDTETFYDSFNRDFSPEEVLELCDVVQEKILPIDNEMLYKLWEIPGFEQILDDPMTFKNPFEVIADYSGNISDNIKERSETLLKDGNYYVKSGSDCYNGSFTIDLPASNDAIIYIHDDKDCYTLLTSIHEFGHYYSSFYDETPDFLTEQNIDIAEIQSQGMEMLFLKFYDDIYGDQAEAMKAFKIQDILYSITSGFAIGEFEYTALDNLDELTPEAVVELFDSTLAKYDIEFNLYEVNHIFEQPAYYISYGVSALAALEIWMASTEDYSKAVKMYDNISRVEANSGDTQFMSVLNSCGFDNVLSEKYIDELVVCLSEYIDTIV